MTVMDVRHVRKYVKDVQVTLLSDPEFGFEF